MSIITNTVLKDVGKAFSLKGKDDTKMFDDLWEVYQVGNKYKRDHKKELADAVEEAYDTIVNIASRTGKASKHGLKRVGDTTYQKLVIFSDHHMTHRHHRHDYFFQFNFKLYLELLEKYEGDGFALVENGDVEELLIFDPTPNEAEKRRKLVTKPLLINDIGKINWDELNGTRLEQRRKILERLFNDNDDYYQRVKKFGKGRYYKISGNHDTYSSGELEGMIENQYWDGIILDALRVLGKATGGTAVNFVITHGHQFDESCVAPHAAKVGEVISECLSWAFQGPDRIWTTSDTHKWTSDQKKEFGNVLSSEHAFSTKDKALEMFLECFMGHEVAWEYFENSDPYMAFVKEVCTGDEFFKYRHMNENNLANALLKKWKSKTGELPTVICGHTHEARHRSRFTNTTSVIPPGTNDKNLFTKYMNTGSAGRFQNLVWCIEIVNGEATVYSWTNSGTKDNIRLKKTKWESNGTGKLIGKDV